MVALSAMCPMDSLSLTPQDFHQPRDILVAVAPSASDLELLHQRRRELRIDAGSPESVANLLHAGDCQVDAGESAVEVTTRDPLRAVANAIQPLIGDQPGQQIVAVDAHTIMPRQRRCLKEQT